MISSCFTTITMRTATVDTIIKIFLELPADASDEEIKTTAEELGMLNFSPTLLVETPGLLYMRKGEIISEAERIADLPAAELPEYNHSAAATSDDFKRKHLDMLYFNYELLCRLRKGQPEAWDYIHELYEDD